jgi:hypothetical protein
MVNNDQPARMPPTGRAPSRVKDSGDMPAQHLKGDSRESGEDIGSLHVKGDAAEEVLAPAVHTSNDVTVNAELSATHISNNDQPARIPPTGRASYRQKYLGEITGLICQGNSRESGKDIAHAFSEDFAEKFQASSPSAVDKQSETGSEGCSVTFKDSINISSHELPTGRASFREKDSGDMPAQHLEGDSRGTVEVIGSLHVNEDAAEEVLASADSTANDANVDVDRSSARVSNNDQPARIPLTGRAPSREKDLGDMLVQHWGGNTGGPVEDITHAFAEDLTEKFQGQSPSAVDKQSFNSSVELQVVSKDSTGICGNKPPTGRAPSREKYLGDMPAQHLEGDSRDPVEVIVQASGKDSTEDVPAPAVLSANGTTVNAGLSAARMGNPGDLSGHVPPLGRAISRVKDSGDMPAQYLDRNAREPVEDLAHAFAEDFDAKFRVSLSSAVNEQPVDDPAERSVTLNDSINLSDHEPPTVCAPSREKDSGDMPAQHLEGNARGPVEDMSLPPLDKDSARNVSVPCCMAESMRPADRPSTSKSSTGCSTQAPPTVRASCRVKDSSDMPGQDPERNARGPVEDIGPYHVRGDTAEDVLAPAVSTANDATVNAGLSAARMGNPGDLCGDEPPTGRAPCRVKDSGDMPAHHLDGDSRESGEDMSLPPLDKDSAQNVPAPPSSVEVGRGNARGPVEKIIVEASSGKYFAEKRQASSLTLNGIPRNMRTWRAHRWGTCNVGKMCTSHREKRQHSGWIMWGILCLCLIQASAFTPDDLGALKSAKSSCLAEASSGNCPNFEATHGEIGTWNTAKVTTLRASESPVHIAVDACFYVC